MNKDPIKRFSVILPLKLYKQIRSFAFKKEQKVAESIRVLLIRGLEAMKNDQ